MSNLKPIVIAVAGAAMLAACSGPAVRQPLRIQGVQRISQSTEQSAASWYRLGKYHQERGQLSLALGAYAQSLALDAGQLDARNAVAAIDAQQGRLADARDALRRLVEDYPGEAQPLNNLGYVYYLMGDYPAAIATLQRAVALDPNGRAYYNLVQAQTAARDGAPAGALAAAAPSPSPATPAVPVTAPVADAGPSVAPSRMELVQVAPQVLELKLRASQTIAAVLALPAAAPVAVAAPPVHIATPAVAATPMHIATPVVAATPAQPAVKATAAALPALTVAAAPAPAPHPAAIAAMAAAPQVGKPAAVAAAPAPVAAATLARPVAVATAAAPAPAAKPAPAPLAKPAPSAVLATTMPRLEISNGNGVTGLAARYRSVLGKVGILASRLSNARPFHQQTSVIEYRPGFAAQAASLQRALPGRTALQQTDALTRADVRLLLGKDAPARLAQAEQLQDGARFAAVDTAR